MSAFKCEPTNLSYYIFSKDDWPTVAHNSGHTEWTLSKMVYPKVGEVTLIGGLTISSKGFQLLLGRYLLLTLFGGLIKANKLQSYQGVTVFGRLGYM